MLAPTHVVIGTALCTSFARVFSLPLDATLFSAVLIGSIAPDIDGGGSISRPGSILRGFLPRPVAHLLNSLGTTLSATLRFFLGHRGFIHAPILGIAFICLGLLLPSPWLFWFGLAYLSHIAADGCTVFGIPLLSPFSSQRYSLLSLKTGAWQEYCIFTLFLIISVWMGIPLLPEETRIALFEWYQSISGAEGR